MTDYEWTNYNFGRKGKWCDVPELGKEKQVFCDLKQDILSYLKQNILSDLWIYLNHSIKRKCCVVLSLVKKTRALAVLTGIL